MMEKLSKTMESLGGKMEIFKERLNILNQSLDDNQWTEYHIAILKEQSQLMKLIEEYNVYKNDYDFYNEMLLVSDGQERVEVMAELHRIGEKVEKYIVSLLFSREEVGDCYVELQSGTGGADAEDLTVLLFKMYNNWAEKTQRKSTVLDTWLTDNGMRSAILKIEGINSYGFLKMETGIHRIVRYSPFNALDKRQTSFIAVYVYPIVEEEAFHMDEKDLKFEFCRSSGAGGQHVNKTESAVRVTHGPSGLVVRCENERSQAMNKQMAIKLLKAKLMARAEAFKQEKEKAMEKTPITWGQQIRSYVFHPYQLIKDLRSQYETKNIEKFLSGDLLNECLYANLMKSL